MIVLKAKAESSSASPINLSTPSEHTVNESSSGKSSLSFGELLRGVKADTSDDAKLSQKGTVILAIDDKEVVVSLKTTSKDRMGKIFLDKLLMQKFAGHSVKVIGIFLNDVQRKETKQISYTFLSGLFMVYTKFLTKLEGVYFIDPPPITKKTPYNQHISPFSKFVTEDIWELLSP